MRGYVPLPSYQVPRNAMLDFSGLNQGIDAIAERGRHDQLTAERKDERQYQRGRNAMADQRYADERAYSRGRDQLQDTRYADETTYTRGRQGTQDQRAATEFSNQQTDRKTDRFREQVKILSGFTRDHILTEQDPAVRAQKWQQLLDSHPDLKDAPDAYRDPATGPELFVSTATGGITDPLKQAQLLKLQQENDAKAKAAAKVSNLGQNISGGLNQLAEIPNKYSGGIVSDPFASAVGSIRGQEDDGGWLPTMSDVGKVWGSLTNIAGNATTSEVRNRIKGDTEALAAAIKPLIRAPGEGPWTDKDQERLVAVVGNLALANTRDEYKRAVEGVRERVMKNFNIDLPPVSWADEQAAVDPASVQAGEVFRYKGRSLRALGGGQFEEVE